MVKDLHCHAWRRVVTPASLVHVVSNFVANRGGRAWHRSIGRAQLPFGRFRPVPATPPSGAHQLHVSRAGSSPGAPCGGGAVAGAAGQVPEQPSALERFPDKAGPLQTQPMFTGQVRTKFAVRLPEGRGTATASNRLRGSPIAVRCRRSAALRPVSKELAGRHSRRNAGWFSWLAQLDAHFSGRLAAGADGRRRIVVVRIGGHTRAPG